MTTFTFVCTPSDMHPFWSRVDVRPDGCWVWLGAKHSGGYGSLRWGGKTVYAHRLAYELRHGQVIGDGRQIDHLCRNRLCVNPEHLEPVSQRTNILRGIGFAARHAAKTHCPQGHAYSGDNLVFDNGSRRCRECRRQHYKRVYAKKKSAK